MFDAIKRSFKTLAGIPRNIVNFHGAWFKRAMEEENINSRLIFLLHGGVSALGILILVIAFCFAANKEHYDYMVLALGGGSTGAAVGRYLTKKNGSDSGNGSEQQPETKS